MYIYIWIYGIHLWRNFRSSYRKLASVEFEPTITEFRLDARYNNDGIRNNYGLKFRLNFHAYEIIRYTFDYWSKKNQKHNTFHSLLSESHSISLLTPWSICWKMLYRPKAKQNATLKRWISQCTEECVATHWYIKYSVQQNVLQHIDSSNAELLISKEDINPLYHFSHCIDSF